MKDKSKNILIVGGGPAGLSSAIFLSEYGMIPKVIDKKESISPYSKALGLNPRTLELFEPSGLTRRFLQNGRKMDKINIWYTHKPVFQNNLSRIKHKYPFMLIQPQKESEELLLEELTNRKIFVEYGTQCKDLQLENNLIEATLENNLLKKSYYDVVIGADGASGIVREKVQIKLEGFRYDEEWELYDIELDMSIAPDEGHIVLFPGGGMILIRLKENVWRVAGNLHSLLNYLPPKTRIGQVKWESKFKISHKVAESMEKNNVLLIGDAAHLHSPVGARGMNLGVEDAFLASQLIKENRVSEFSNLRRPYVASTVRRINQMTQGLTGNTFLARTLRKNISKIRFAFPLFMPSTTKFILGLK